MRTKTTKFAGVGEEVLCYTKERLIMGLTAFI